MILRDHACVFVMIPDQLLIQPRPISIHAHEPQSVIVIRAFTFSDAIPVHFEFLLKADVAFQASFWLWTMPVNDDLQTKMQDIQCNIQAMQSACEAIVSLLTICCVAKRCK